MITSQLLKQPFDKVGSLTERDGGYHVEECLSRALTWSARDSFDTIARGPFNNDREYYDALLSALCRHAEKLPLEHHIFRAPVPKLKEFLSHSSYHSAVQTWNDFVTVGSNIDSSKNRLDYITMAHILRNIMPSISTNEQKYISNLQTLVHQTFLLMMTSILLVLLTGHRASLFLSRTS